MNVLKGNTEAERLTPPDGFLLRHASMDDLEEINEIEHICFPEHEACSKEHFAKRLSVAPDHFWILEDREADGGKGRIAGFVNDIATDKDTLSDEMFTEIVAHKPDGAYLMVLGLCVRPEYRKRGFAGLLMRTLLQHAGAEGRKGAALTCHDFLVPYYERFGYRNLGVSQSAWGGETWYDMRVEFPLKTDET